MYLSRIGAGILMLAVVGGALWYLLSASPSETTRDDEGKVLILAYAQREPGSPDLEVELGLKSLALMTPSDSVALSWLTEHVRLLTSSQQLRTVLDTTTPAGTYSGLSFELRDMVVHTNPGDEASEIQLRPFMSHVALDVPFVVTPHDTYVYILGFETLRSQRETDSGVVYFPTMNVEVRKNPTLSTDEYGNITVSGGEIVHNTLFGMDQSGTVRKNYRVK